MVQCVKCRQSKDVNDFHTYFSTPRQKRYRQLACKQCLNAADTKRKKETLTGYLCACYKGMRVRVEGRATRSAHIWKGLPLLERSAFYSWALANPTFHALFAKWRESGFNRLLSPSVNRIDGKKGYLLDNIEWLTNVENARRATRGT